MHIFVPINALDMPVNMEIAPNIYWDCAEHSVADTNFSFPIISSSRGSSISEDDEDHRRQSLKQKITMTRNPMSHRIIEKRRRDRMNNCLADLSRLIPAEYMKKGRGRIEKTEIIEMAIKHMKTLQTSMCSKLTDHCKMNAVPCDSINDEQLNGAKVTSDRELSTQEYYKLGYQKCVDETISFLVQLHGFLPSDALCVKLISHLQKYYEKLTKGDKIVISRIFKGESLPSISVEIENNATDGMTKISDRVMANSSRPPAVSSDDSSQENNLINDSFRYGSNDGSYCSESSSQLREMLISPLLNSLYIPLEKSDMARFLSPNPPSSQQDFNNDSQSSNGSLYKFKNYIRERFEHSNGKNSSEIVCSKKKIPHSSSSIATSLPYSRSSLTEECKNAPTQVPIFALHSKELHVTV